MTVNLQKNQTKRYLLYLLLILILVDILDQYSTNYIKVITCAVIDQFLPVFSPEKGEAIFAVCACIATIGM